jgi:hypothetical protein
MSAEGVFFYMPLAALLLVPSPSSRPTSPAPSNGDGAAHGSPRSSTC